MLTITHVHLTSDVRVRASDGPCAPYLTIESSGGRQRVHVFLGDPLVADEGVAALAQLDQLAEAIDAARRLLASHAIAAVKGPDDPTDDDGDEPFVGYSPTAQPVALAATRDRDGWPVPTLAQAAELDRLDGRA